MKMFWFFKDCPDARELLDSFLVLEEVTESLGFAISKYYSAIGLKGGFVVLKNTASLSNKYGHRPQENTVLPFDLVALLVDNLRICLTCKPNFLPGWMSYDRHGLCRLPEI